MSIISKVSEFSLDVSQLETYLNKINSKKVIYHLTCMMYLGREKLSGNISKDANVDVGYTLGVVQDKMQENMKELIENNVLLPIYFDQVIYK